MAMKNMFYRYIEQRAFDKVFKPKKSIKERWQEFEWVLHTILMLINFALLISLLF